jgi:endonuclease YncB( thermonuclease family)
MQISLQNYETLLSEIQKIIGQTEQRIVADVNHEKVKMVWEIGKMLDGHLLKNRKVGYGERLVFQLEKDVFISRKTLYRMHAFYKTYPILPTKDKGLSWSHYKSLMVVKSDEKRKYLEDLVIEKKLGSGDLQKKISAESKRKKKISKPKNQKLKFTRGVLFTYKLAELQGSGKTFVDCGFNVFVEAPSQSQRWTGFVIPPKRSVQSKNGNENEWEDGVANPVLQRGLQQVVSSVKNGEKISLRKSELNPNQLHTYKAYLDKVVDGDTLHVTLDLGFKIRHKEILRLAKINSPEAETFEGKKSSDELKKILADVPFLIVKTNKTDIYGRYVADVFLAGKRSPYLGGSSERVSGAMGVNDQAPEKVASEGVYLNQMLVDAGVAEVF